MVKKILYIFSERPNQYSGGGKIIYSIVKSAKIIKDFDFYFLCPINSKEFFLNNKFNLRKVFFYKQSSLINKLISKFFLFSNSNALQIIKRINKLKINYFDHILIQRSTLGILSYKINHNSKITIFDNIEYDYAKINLNFYDILISFVSEILSSYFSQNVWFFTHEDLRRHKKLYGNYSRCIRKKINLPFYSDGIIKNHKRNNLIYIGNLKFKFNKISLIKLITKLNLPNYILRKLIIIGRRPDKDLTNFLIKNKIKFIFDVENLKEHLKKAKAIIIFDNFGTGIKTRVVEAMSFGIPIIANNLAIKGYNINNKSFFIKLSKKNISSFLKLSLKEQKKISQESHLFWKKKSLTIFI